MNPVRSLRHLITDQDLSPNEIWKLFELTKELKESAPNKTFDLLRGKNLAMIFQKPSTRTRVSFEVAMNQLGGHALYLSSSDLQLSRGESIEDTARTLSRYVDGILARVFDHQDIIKLAKNSSVPVINGLSSDFHPCQALTDLFTIWEKRGTPHQCFGKGLSVSFVGDGDNNVTNSLLLLCARLGINLKIGCPAKYKISQGILDLAKSDILKNKVKIEIFSDPREAVKDVEVIYTDVWVSMGRKDEKERIETLSPFQVNKKLLSFAKKGAMVMHCLPAHRGQEIVDEVIDGPNSIVFDQAENRLHVQKAILTFLLKA
ncbi:MAG: ornithine carbamoyltransferase [Candidatus Nealsonbacteria bacterium]|nr:ornithine carbamoyltransferase [Candidatus Nealsonbacteria bacterium]